MTMRTEKSALLAAVAAVTLSIAAPLALAAAAGSCVWDNNSVTNGFSGRAISPPSFPDIRLVDDIVVRNAQGCEMRLLEATILEDGAFVPGRRLEVYVYEDLDGVPKGGPPRQTVYTNFLRRATGDTYFGRSAYDYTLAPRIDLEAGRYWIGVRHPDGAGSGTAYWMTSNGGPDGMNSSNGYFSLNAGQTWLPEGPLWHHAFRIEGGNPLGACCARDATCAENVPLEDCDGRFALGTSCDQLDPPCVNGACCEDDATCTDDVPSAECDARFEPDTLCADLDPPCHLAGACCRREGDCSYPVNEEDCDGRWSYATSCDDLYPECLPLGACCRHDGVCFDDVSLGACVGRFDPLIRCGESGPCEPIRWPFCENERIAAWPRDGGTTYFTDFDLHGNRLALGVPNAYNRRGFRTGVVYIYERDDDGRWWGTATAAPRTTSQGFDTGRDLLLHGDTLFASQFDDRFVVYRKAGVRWDEIRSFVVYTGASRAPQLAASGPLFFVGDDRLTTQEQPGLVHVRREGPPGEWIRVTAPQSLDRHPRDAFGGAVAVREDELVVGAPEEDYSSSPPGAAYVFRRNPDDTWTQTARLAAPEGSADDQFGCSLSFDGERVVVGASGMDAREGAVYVFTRSPGGHSWMLEQRLKPSPFDNMVRFGERVAMRFPLLAVTAWEQTGQSMRRLTGFLFMHAPSGEWRLLAKLPTTDTQSSTSRAVVRFGEDVFVLAERDPDVSAVRLFDIPCADFTDDGTVDLDDYRYFHDCLTGPGGEVTPSCLRADLDFDGDADLMDYRVFQEALPAT
jgi:hypothetical protein